MGLRRETSPCCDSVAELPFAVNILETPCKKSNLGPGGRGRRLPSLASSCLFPAQLVYAFYDSLA